MNNKKVKAIPWMEAYNKLSTSAKERNAPLFQIISDISKQLESSGSNYVYYTELNFGDKIIDKGHIPIDTFDVSYDTEINKSVKTFKSDLDYSSDPLGLVIKNHIEIYTENKSNGKYGESFNIYLNEICAGEFFGVFGTLNMAAQVSEPNKSLLDWYGIAGNICIELAFPWKRPSYTDGINAEDLKLFQNPNHDYIGEEKVEFFKKYCPNDWKVGVVYFPKHFLTILDSLLKIKFENELYKIGWRQSHPLMDLLFENKAISCVIYERLKSVSLVHDRHFLSLLYDYLRRALKGGAYVLKPITDDHIIATIIKRFKENHSTYYKSKNAKNLLAFKNGLLCENQIWGLISMFHLPILINYDMKSPSRLIEDLKKINNEISTDLKIKEFIGYSLDGNKPTEHLLPLDSLKQHYLKEAFCIDNEDSIHLANSQFANLILLKRTNN